MSSPSSKRCGRRSGPTWRSSTPGRPDRDLQGKVAVVTGAAGGIGAACARALAGAGADCWLVDRDAGRLEVLAGELGCGSVAADVSSPEGAQAAAGGVLGAAPGVDVLVQSAGIQRYGSVIDTHVETWDEVMAVNVRSMFLMAHHLMPSLVERRGAVVNVGSVQSQAALPNSAAYVASKHAVWGLTQAMAADHAPQVRVNCVAPGSVRTPMLEWTARHFDLPADEAFAAWAKIHPLGRIAEPEEVAEAVLFLAGPRASFITGTCVNVDGGLRAVIR